MSPEAKAREIVHQISTHSQIFESDVELVAQALRDVERETIERAAKVAEDYGVSTGDFGLDAWSDATLDRQEKIAHSIRSLLQKEGG